MDWVVNVLAFCLVSLLVIPIHEFCHLIFGKLFGVKVRRFSIGFPPKIWSKKLGETEYCVSAIPLGGYVKLAGHGEKPSEYQNEDPNCLFYAKPAWQRIIIIAVGPLSNLFLAGVLLSGIYFFVGRPVITSRIGFVLDNSPASKAYLQPNDLILSVNGQKVEIWNEVTSAIIFAGDEKMEMVILRGDNKVSVQLQAEMMAMESKDGQKTKKLRIGIGPGERKFRYPEKFFAAFKKGFLETVGLVSESSKSVYQLSVGDSAVKENLAGPLMIIATAGDAFREGAVSFLYLSAMISIAIGFFNLLPIPGLDGGYILFHLIELIRGKRLSRKTESLIILAGFLFLLAFIIFITTQDVSKLF